MGGVIIRFFPHKPRELSGKKKLREALTSAPPPLVLLGTPGLQLTPKSWTLEQKFWPWASRIHLLPKPVEQKLSEQILEKPRREGLLQACLPHSPPAALVLPFLFSSLAACFLSLSVLSPVVSITSHKNCSSSGPHLLFFRWVAPALPRGRCCCSPGTSGPGRDPPSCLRDLAEYPSVRPLPALLHCVSSAAPDPLTSLF